jgi:hypothetical protein
MRPEKPTVCLTCGHSDFIWMLGQWRCSHCAPACIQRAQDYIFPPMDGAPKTRRFETGATRDSDAGKYDYEGFLSPLVLEAFGAYMHKHRTQSDGKLRDSDNWQKGMPRTQYIKSAWRHFHRFWAAHRGYSLKDEKGNAPTLLDDAMAILFNIMGYVHVLLVERESQIPPYTDFGCTKDLCNNG